MTARAKLGLALAGFAALAVFVYSRITCVSALLRYGIDVPVCPEGVPRQTAWASVRGLRRGTAGEVRVGALAHFTAGSSDEDRTAGVSGARCELSLVAGGQETPLPPRGAWRTEGIGLAAQVVLPDVPDGDHVLRARVRTRLGQSSVDVPLPVYAPARVHVLTDRPLYQPGQVVLFRAVALRARDLSPLDGRPGAFVVEDPAGEVLLEEKAPAGDWGVASGSFPLDASAPAGTWKVRWVSGGARGEARFSVEPFTLPRFRVEATSRKPFWRPGEIPALRGTVVYSSGAPVGRARVQIQWSHEGAWPPPTSWLERELPRDAAADAQGRFALELPRVPADLVGQATLAARIVAFDPAGDRAESAARILLSRDAILVSAVTEMGDGLVEGTNNRLFLRVTDAAGEPLPKAELSVQRAWDPSDPGIRAQADEDAVAALQIDPGAAVNVVLPAMPYRPPPRLSPVSRTSVGELMSGAEPPLPDLKALDDLEPSLEPCARFLEGNAESARVGLRADSAGLTRAVAAEANPAAACLASALGARRLPPGPERLYDLEYLLRPSDLPELAVEVKGVAEPREIVDALNLAARDARACLSPALSEQAGFPRLLTFRARKDRREVELEWIADPSAPDRRVSPAEAGCVEARFRAPPLSEPAPQDGLGFARLRADPRGSAHGPRIAPSTTLGYELLVTARVGGEAVGSTRLVLQPGAVPDVRLRATPIVVEPGAALSVELLRGPSFRGELPEMLALQTERTTLEVPVNREARTAVFQVPPDAQGWLEARWSGARAVAYVRPRAQLTVALSPEREHYAPGQTARLRIQTRAGEKGVPAAVGLFGVDESLGQLAALPGPAELANLQVAPSVLSKAFDVLDAQALAAGRVRGANAAMATVLKVSAIPQRQETDSAINARVVEPFSPLEDLTDRFYAVLAELHAQVRAWEDRAPEKERMRPATMARLWKDALAACQARGEKVADAYGRPLRLSRLPDDLLELVNPRNVVARGTRLPEDVENWAAWVAKEEP